MTKWTRIAPLVLAGWALPAFAAAQTAQAPLTEQQRMTVEQATAAQGRGGGRGGFVASVETRVTAGRPYSADAVTESLQVLGDGNRIAKRSVTRVFRDNEGRTRREQLGENGLATTISINDPVAGRGYTLDPASKTAFESRVLQIRTATLATGGGSGAGAGAGAGAGTGGGVARGSGGGSGGAAPPSDEARRLVEKMTAARVEQAETSRAAASQSKQVIERAASGGARATKEDLGEQSIEGVRATGTRTTTIIPAGSSLGNLNEIRIVSEQWFSPDLELFVLTRHSDPRVGETIYKLTSIVRAQPDPNLFVVPADYTVKSRTVRND